MVGTADKVWYVTGTIILMLALASVLSGFIKSANVTGASGVWSRFRGKWSNRVGAGLAIIVMCVSGVRLVLGMHDNEGGTMSTVYTIISIVHCLVGLGVTIVGVVGSFNINANHQKIKNQRRKEAVETGKQMLHDHAEIKKSKINSAAYQQNTRAARKREALEMRAQNMQNLTSTVGNVLTARAESESYNQTKLATNQMKMANTRYGAKNAKTAAQERIAERKAEARERSADRKATMQLAQMQTNAALAEKRLEVGTELTKAKWDHKEHAADRRTERSIAYNQMVQDAQKHRDETRMQMAQLRNEAAVQMSHDRTLMAIADKLGINVDGKSDEQIADNIIAFAPKAALAEMPEGLSNVEMAKQLLAAN